MYRSSEKREETLAFLNHHGGDSTQIEWFKADINNIPQLEDAFTQITQVYHCAGLVSFDIRDRKKLRKINIEGTANMVNISLAKGVEKFCHLSSVAALGEEQPGKKITEKSERAKNKTYNYYEISKFGAEMEVWRASQEGLKVVIVNPAIIIGSGNWHSGSGRLFSQVDRGFPFRIPKESGFISVQDVVQAMIQLMDSPVVNRGYILVSEVQSFAAITDQIARVLQKKAPRYRLTKWMIFMLWLGHSIRYIFGGKKEISFHNIPSFFKSVSFDNSKIQKEIGFRFTPVSEAIQRTGEEFLAEKTSQQAN